MQKLANLLKFAGLAFIGLFFILLILGAILFISGNNVLGDLGLGDNPEENQSQNNSLPSYDFQVKAEDVKTGEQISTGYVVVEVTDSGREIIHDGQTTSKGFEGISLNMNTSHMYYFLNYGGDYYSNKRIVTGPGEVTMETYPVGDLNVSIAGQDNESYFMKLEANEGQVRQIGVCVKHTIGYQDFSPVSDTPRTQSIQTPERLKDESPDGCYWPFWTIEEGKSRNLEFTYDDSQGIEESDEVELIFFDADKNYKSDYIVQDQNGGNVGGEDVRYTIEGSNQS